MAKVTGHNQDYVYKKMSHIEGLVWEQKYWEEFQGERERTAFGKVAKIRCIPAFQDEESELL